LKKLSLATLLVTTILSLSSASVVTAKETGSGPNPFSDCGIGAAIFKNTAWAAVTSNITWDVGSTAITSATASPETCQKQNVETAQFILDTYDNLVEETAQGEGAHLTAMMNILGCDASVQSSVKSEIRSGAATAVASDTYNDKNAVQKASDLYNVVHHAAQSCSA